jgi:hypothetical protein
MKIAFYGSSLVSAYWNGAATYYRGLLRALAEKGYDITFYEPDVYDRQKNRDIEPPEWCKVVVYEGTIEALKAWRPRGLRGGCGRQGERRRLRGRFAARRGPAGRKTHGAEDLLGRGCAGDACRTAGRAGSSAAPALDRRSIWC